MARYCNYFLSLFDLKRIIPFYQMVKKDEVDEVRHQIRTKVDRFLQ